MGYEDSIFIEKYFEDRTVKIDHLVMYDHWFFMFNKDMHEVNQLTFKNLMVGAKKALAVKAIGTENLQLINDNTIGRIKLYDGMLRVKNNEIEERSKSRYRDEKKQELLSLVKINRFDLVSYLKKKDLDFIAGERMLKELDETSRNHIKISNGWRTNDAFALDDFIDFGSMKDKIFSTDTMQAFIENCGMKNAGKNIIRFAHRLDHSSMLVGTLPDFFKLKKTLLSRINFEYIRYFYTSLTFKINPFKNSCKARINRAAPMENKTDSSYMEALKYLDKFDMETFFQMRKERTTEVEKEAAFIAAIFSDNPENEEAFKHVHAGQNPDGEPYSFRFNGVNSDNCGSLISFNHTRYMNFESIGRISKFHASIFEFGVDKIYSQSVMEEMIKNKEGLLGFLKVGNKQAAEKQKYQHVFSKLEVQANFRFPRFLVSNQSIPVLGLHITKPLVSMVNKFVQIAWDATDILGNLMGMRVPQKDSDQCGISLYSF